MFDLAKMKWTYEPDLSDGAPPPDFITVYLNDEGCECTAIVEVKPALPTQAVMDSYARRATRWIKEADSRIPKREAFIFQGSPYSDEAIKLLKLEEGQWKEVKVTSWRRHAVQAAKYRFDLNDGSIAPQARAPYVPPRIDSVICYLYSLVTKFPGVVGSLRERPEISRGVAWVPGGDVLQRFLSGETVNDEDLVFMMEDPTFALDPPDNYDLPGAIEEAVTHLLSKALRREAEQIRIDLAHPELTADQMLSLLKRSSEIAEILRGLPIA
ncbi:hypothetical protein [Luteolibacter luteus]|uniref:Uncharacterized protein n=1 Tax=Luteolibacter luteus TaxID=2728835 RepID=A0A858RGS6_9BACT|nr:hypothetical protein [Luteolibacter luteus]QJE95992.1 hypothetical protein HHL09_09420 [Luteolibacter luteus]